MRLCYIKTSHPKKKMMRMTGDDDVSLTEATVVDQTTGDDRASMCWQIYLDFC